MTDPRPLRLREGSPATDILSADGRTVLSVHRVPLTKTPEAVLRSIAEAEAIAAEMVRAYNALPDLVAKIEWAIERIDVDGGMTLPEHKATVDGLRDALRRVDGRSPQEAG